MQMRDTWSNIRPDNQTPHLAHIVLGINLVNQGRLYANELT